eukprot:TRINITY_DN11973_c2_g8_i1.p1 TRINITY_DN11973_c2_g8~~TRINITY_DN11973_c2_g8_i1.p1  ORF type:complete len:404 (-),score=29.86 TRINITY_DN11973_c2_g8_i1:290-1501(-)
MFFLESIQYKYPMGQLRYQKHKSLAATWRRNKLKRRYNWRLFPQAEVNNYDSQTNGSLADNHREIQEAFSKFMNDLQTEIKGHFLEFEFRDRYRNQQFTSQLENVNQKVLEVSQQNSRDAASFEKILETIQDIKQDVQTIRNSNVLSKVNCVESALEGIQQQLKDNNQDQSRLFEDSRKLLDEVRYITPLLSANKGGDMQNNLFYKQLEDEIKEIKNSLQKENFEFKEQLAQKQAQISDLQKKVQRLEDIQQEIENKAYSKYDVSKLHQVKLVAVKYDQYNSFKERKYELTFDVLSDGYKQFSIYVPDAIFGYYLYYYHNDCSSDKDYTYRNIWWTMVLLLYRAQKIVIYENGIDKDVVELEMIKEGKQIYYFNGKIAHSILIALYFDAPIYITNEVAKNHCT